MKPPGGSKFALFATLYMVERRCEFGVVSEPMPQGGEAEIVAHPYVVGHTIVQSHQ